MIGYKRRAAEGTSDPTSTPTRKRGSAHIEVLAAADKDPGMRLPKGMPKKMPLRQRTLANKGEST